MVASRDGERDAPDDEPDQGSVHIVPEHAWGAHTAVVAADAEHVELVRYRAVSAYRSGHITDRVPAWRTVPLVLRMARSE